VLVGIQVPEKEKPSFQKFLDGLGYRYWTNPAIRPTSFFWPDAYYLVPLVLKPSRL